MVRAAILNVLLAAGLLGYPLYRGRVRADAMARAYAAYAACMHGEAVADAPGLALPEGHRERFAALYLQATQEWPASCRDELERIPQEEAFLLMPGAKTGEEEVRSAVIGARAALQDVVEARATEHRPPIPHQLLRTLDHLAAAVSISATETGLPIEAEHLAFDLGEGPSLVEPSRVPLQTANGGPLLVTATDDHVLRAVAADARSIAIVQVHEGTVDIVQVRRPPSARAIVDDGHATYLGWITGDATCAHDDAHCANRLTGLARVRDEAPDPSPEVWIAAHPALTTSRSFVLEGGTLRVIAREPDGGISLRTFALPEPWPAPAPASGPGTAVGPGPEGPSVARTRELLGSASDAVVVGEHAVASDAGAVFACGERIVVVADGTARVRAPTPAPTTSVPSAPVLGTDPAPRPEVTFPLHVREPVRSPDPMLDGARCALGRGGASFAWVDDEQILHLVTDLDAPHDQFVAEHVAGFAMSRAGETVLFATWGEDDDRTVTLRRVWRGRVLATDVAAACWDDGSGLCGPAGLVASGNESFLYVRSESDLLVLRVTGAGLAALVGLE